MFRTDAATGSGLEKTASQFSSESKVVQRVLKRLIDIVGASFVLVLFLPVLCIVAVGVIMSSGWPLIYSHRRVGLNGKTFMVHKFRSMRRNADQALKDFLDSNPAAREEWNAFQKLKEDPRVTRFGRFLRSSSLDEFPQLWNVLKGEMSLVGPRPVTAAESAKYGEHWHMYCAAKPGISGLWQVNGRNGLSYAQRVAFDVIYVRDWSLFLDIKILLKTFVVVLRRDGSM